MLCFIQSQLCEQEDDNDDDDNDNDDNDDDGNDDGEGAQATNYLELGCARIRLSDKLKKVIALDNILNTL